MKLFVDTSAWLALGDRNDQYHKEALARSASIKKQKIELVTSDYIFDESITIIRYRMSHRAAVTFGNSLMGSTIVKITGITDEERSKAWKLFSRYDDKELSFTDCTSFVLMKKLGIQKAFTFDDHFRQLGFEVF